MGKYARDLDEKLVNKVKKMAKEFGLTEKGVNVEAIRLKKSKNSIGEIVRAPRDLIQVFIGAEDLIAIALYEDAFLQVDDATQDIWIESLISQISYDDDKEKIVVTKPELQVGVGMYRKYGNIAVQKAELAILTVQTIREKKKALKNEQK